MNVEGWKAMNLALSFFLELCALASLSYFGIRAGNTGVLKTILGILLPLSVAFVWGRFLAPKSTKKLHGSMYVGLKMMILGISIVALWSTGLHSLAMLFAILVLVNRLFSYVWRQR